MKEKNIKKYIKVFEIIFICYFIYLYVIYSWNHIYEYMLFVPFKNFTMSISTIHFHNWPITSFATLHGLKWPVTCSHFYVKQKLMYICMFCNYYRMIMLCITKTKIYKFKIFSNEKKWKKLRKSIKATAIAAMSFLSFNI